MKVYYDKEVDALYIKLGNKTPEGVMEISEGVNLDTTSETASCSYLPLMPLYSFLRWSRFAGNRYPKTGTV